MLERYQRRASRLTAQVGAVVRDARRVGARVLSAPAVSRVPARSRVRPRGGRGPSGRGPAPWCARPLVRERNGVEKMSGIDIRRIGGRIGAEITGIDLGATITDQMFSEIKKAFLEYKVLFVTDQEISDEQQLAFAGRFGPLTHRHPLMRAAGESPQVLVVDGEDQRAKLSWPSGSRPRTRSSGSTGDGRTLPVPRRLRRRAHFRQSLHAALWRR